MLYTLTWLLTSRFTVTIPEDGLGETNTVAFDTFSDSPVFAAHEPLSYQASVH
ncbi:MAG: hypothetical protein H7282_00675 [Cytophagaceae bacterium]|nr:hypothetical protein [Cytophagaceae bacterium]